MFMHSDVTAAVSLQRTFDQQWDAGAPPSLQFPKPPEAKYRPYHHLHHDPPYLDDPYDSLSDGDPYPDDMDMAAIADHMLDMHGLPLAPFHL